MKQRTDASKYEILYDLPQGEYSATEVGGIRTRTIRAGESLEVEAFPITSLGHEARQEAKRRSSSPAQEKLNLERCRKCVRRLLETNFQAGDLVLGLTYDYGFVNRGFENLDDVRAEWKRLGFPEDEEDAARDFRNFIRRVKNRVRRNGGDAKDFKYVYVVESTCEPNEDEVNPLPAHYHCHMVISCMGVLSIADINELWPFGYANAKPLDFRFNGLEGLSKYIIKQPGRKKHYHKYCASKNLKKPDERVSDRKISRRRAAQIAADVQANGREILEKIYPGYVLEDCRVKYSDFVAGAYIYARLRRWRKPEKKKREGKEHGKRKS